MVKLSKRLSAIASLVPLDSYIADVGADHGKLGIYLLENNLVNRVFSIENKIGPFLGMKNNFTNANLLSKVDLSMSDGISEINSKVDTLILAGMGGLLINSILTKDVSKLSNIKTIIVDAHTDTVEVRKLLISLGYAITDEKIVLEDRIFYTIIRFDRFDVLPQYDEDDLYFGPVLRNDQSDIYRLYLKSILDKLSSILELDNLPQSKRNEYENIKRKVEEKL